MDERKVVIFCSASYDIDPEYNVIARQVVRTLCGHGFTIVSGGTIKGTMGAIADETARCGGRHIGVVPEFMKDLVHPALSETIWTRTMSGRKEAMREGTVAAIALPGGVGTLDELVETLVLSKLDKYPGKVYALNYKGFYAPMTALLDHYVRTGMLDRRSRELIEFPDTVEELAGHFN